MQVSKSDGEGGMDLESNFVTLKFYPICLDFIDEKVTATRGVKLDFRGVKMVS